MMREMRLPGFLLGVTAVVLALSATCAVASSGPRLELKAESKPLAVGGEVLLVAGYSLTRNRGPARRLIERPVAL